MGEEAKRKEIMIIREEGVFGSNIYGYIDKGISLVMIDLYDINPFFNSWLMKLERIFGGWDDVGNFAFEKGFFFDQIIRFYDDCFFLFFQLLGEVGVSVAGAQLGKLCLSVAEGLPFLLEFRANPADLCVLFAHAFTRTGQVAHVVLQAFD